MPTLGELLSTIVQGLGQGVGHEYATATRGGDYLQKEEMLARTGRSAAIEQGGALRDAALKQAAIKAAALQSREGQTSVIDSEVGTPPQATTTQDLAAVPEGADDMLAAAIGDRQLKTRQDEANLEKTGSVAELNSMKAMLANPEFVRALAGQRQGSAETIAKGHDAASTANAETAAGARVEAAQTAAEARKYAASHKAPPKPKEMFYRDADGNEVYGDPHGVAGAQRALGQTSSNQLSAAKITESLGSEVSALIDQAEAAGEIGAIAGKEQFVLDEIGNMGPAAGELKAAIVNLAASHLRLTGTRGTAVQKRIEDLLTGTQTVPSLRAKLAGIMRLSQASDKVLGSKKKSDASIAPAEAPKRLKFNPETGELE